MPELPGVDLTALAGWLDAAHPGLRRGELSGEVIAGGKSNLTYRIGDGSSTWALRRPPLAHVLPTAHDMVREFRVISALADTSVPVARAVALCTDPAVLGAPFYLMGFVDGLVFDRPDALARLDPPAARTACEQLVDTLVRLHAVDPARVGLADFGRPEGFLARQVRRWHQQWQANETEHRTDLADVRRGQPGQRGAQRRRQLRRLVGRGQVMHGDVDRRVPDARDRQLLQPQQCLGRRPHLLAQGDPPVHNVQQRLDRERRADQRRRLA